MSVPNRVAALAVVVLLVGSSLVVAGSAAASQPAPDGENWPSDGRDGNNTGYSPAATAPTSNPSVAWTHNGSYEAMVTNPVVVDGTVYLGGGREDTYENERFFALDAATGDEQWVEIFDFGYSGSFASTPAVTDDRIFVGTECHACNFDYTEAMLSLDRESGSIEWKYQQSDTYGEAKVVDGTAFFGNNAGRFLATDAETGTVEWVKRFEGNRIEFPRAPAVHDGTVYVTKSAPVNLTLHAYDQETGEQQWETLVHEGNCCSTDYASGPVIADGKVFVGTEDEPVKAFDLETGEHLWTHEGFGEGTASGLAAAGNTVYAANWDGTAYALSTADGSVRWEQPLPGGAHAAPSVANGVVYVGDDTSQLHAFDADSGQRLWGLKLDSQIRTTPVPYQGNLYVASDDTMYSIQGDVNESYGDGVTYGVVEHTAELGVTPTTPTAGSAVTASVAGSEHVERVQYDFDGDGSYDRMSETDDLAAEYSFDEAGSYEVSALVTYSDRSTQTLTASFDVEPASGASNDGDGSAGDENAGDDGSDESAGEDGDDGAGDGSDAPGSGDSSEDIPVIGLLAGLVVLLAAALVVVAVRS